MTVNESLAIIDNFIASELLMYQASKDSKDEDGNNIPHFLETVTPQTKLLALDYGLKNTALLSKPLKLIESDGSTASEFKRLSVSEYIRVPTTPTVGGTLDIDESLSYAVIYKALAYIYKGFSSYNSESNMIITSYNDVMRDFFAQRDKAAPAAKILYFRFSIDGAGWHDTYQDGDIFISFRQDEGEWTQAIRFVGAGASGGGGASSFVELIDTPNTLISNKIVAVNSDASGLIFVDMPAAGGGGAATLEGLSGGDTVSGTLALDFRYTSGNKSTHCVFLDGDLTIEILKPDGFNPAMELGVIYTLQIFCEGFTCNIATTMMGDVSLDPSAYANFLQIMYDGFDVFVVNNTKIQ